MIATIIVSAIAVFSEAPTIAPIQALATGNPIIPGYYADPEIRLFQGRYWIYPTTDDSPREAYVEAFSSPDLTRWRPEGRVLTFAGMPWTTYRLAWAPSVIERNGRYFMYSGAGDGKGLGVAVASSPKGPFRDALGKPIVAESPFGAQPIDPMAYIDEDGQAYLYFGGHRHCVVAKLAKDMTSLAGPFQEITPEGYAEGPFMFKRKGTYYLSWSEGNWMDTTYSVAYAKSSSPLGPFKRIGTILKGDDRIATGAGHHSVLRLPNSDHWVIAYHRRPVPDTVPGHRVVCLERLRFDDRGDILPVTLTQEGVPPWSAKPRRR
jgi:beta-xylosidase